MRAHTARPLLFSLVVFTSAAAAAPALAAQEGGSTKKEEEELRKRLHGEARDADEPAAPAADAGAAEGQALIATDALGWEALTQDLFVSGERGIANPGQVEPEPRRAFRFGGVALLPKIDEEVMYDDNVFLTDDDEEDDFILRSRFALLADWDIGTSGHRVSAGYDMLRNWFMGGEARNFVEQFASAQLELNFRHLRFTVGDRWEDRTDPILSVFTGKIERTINTIHGTAGWYEDARYFEAKAYQIGTEYDDASFQGFDRDERLAHGEYGWLASEELWAFVRAGAIDRVFDQDLLNDMAGVTASGGLRYRRGPEFDGSIRVGVRYETFDDDVGDEDDSAFSPDAEARAIFWPTRQDQVDGRYVHTTEFSPVSNYQVLDRAEVGWMRLLTGRVRGRVGLGIEHVDPSDVNDTFWRYVVGAGLTWRVREYIDVTCNWRLRIRATDDPNGDYTGNQIGVGVAVRL